MGQLVFGRLVAFRPMTRPGLVWLAFVVLAPALELVLLASAVVVVVTPPGLVLLVLVLDDPALGPVLASTAAVLAIVFVEVLVSLVVVVVIDSAVLH